MNLSAGEATTAHNKTGSCRRTGTEIGLSVNHLQAAFRAHPKRRNKREFAELQLSAAQQALLCIKRK